MQVNALWSKPLYQVLAKDMSLIQQLFALKGNLVPDLSNSGKIIKVHQ